MNNPQQFELVKECIREITNIGGETFVNICNGSRIYVEWGSGDWIIYSWGFAIAILLLVCLAYAIYNFIRQE